MGFVSIVSLLVIGALSGFLAGLFGAAGAVILVPALLYYLQGSGVTSLVGMYLTLGTSLLVLAVMSAVEARPYHRNNQIVWRDVWLLGGMGVVGAVLGTTGAVQLEAKTLQRLFGVVLILATLRLFVETRKPKGEVSGLKKQIGLLAGGLVVGAVTPFAATGAGLVSFPLLYRYLHFPWKKALGTSHAALVMTAFFSAASFAVLGRTNILLPEFTFGYVAYLHAVPLAIGVIPLLMLGSSLAERWKLSTARKVYAVALLIGATRMLLL